MSGRVLLQSQASSPRRRDATSSRKDGSCCLIASHAIAAIANATQIARAFEIGELSTSPIASAASPATSAPREPQVRFLRAPFGRLLQIRAGYCLRWRWRARNGVRARLVMDNAAHYRHDGDRRCRQE